MALFRTNQARHNLNDWLAQDPGRGSNSYGTALQSALANAAARKTPAQRYNTGADPNVAASRENYRLMAQRAADTAAAQTEALSGGYGADYAASAAEQGRQLLMEGQHDNEYALRQLALQGYAAENDRASAQTDALLAAQQLEQNANQMAMERYQAQRDFLTGEVQQAQTEQDNFWDQLVNGLMWAANVALQTYDNYKGYSQWQQEYDLAVRQYEDELARQTMLDARDEERYRDEQALIKEQWDAELADQEWNRSITERKLALDELAYQDDHAYTAAQIANMGRSRSSGGSSSGGLDYGDAIALLEGYSKAYMTDDPTVAVYDALLGSMGLSPSSYGSTSTGAAPAASTGGNTTGVGQGISGLDYTSYAREMRAKGYSIPEIKEQFDAMRGNNTITSNMPTQADAAYVLAMANPNLTDEEIYRILNGG